MVLTSRNDRHKISSTLFLRKTVSLQISGKGCASCVARIERRLKAIDGVKEARVNLATEKAAIIYDPDVVKEKNFGQVIEDLGYQVSPIEEKKEKLTIAIGGITCAAFVNSI